MSADFVAEGATDWAYLEHFTPLLLSPPGHGDNHVSLADLSAEATKQVTARLH